MCPPLNERILNHILEFRILLERRWEKGVLVFFLKGADVLFRVMLKEAEARWRRQGGALFGNMPL